MEKRASLAFDSRNKIHASPDKGATSARGNTESAVRLSSVAMRIAAVR